MTTKKAKRIPNKVTSSTKVTLTALSVLGFMGGWNLMANVEGQVEQSVELVAESPALPVSSLPSVSTATAPPAIAPLPTLAPIPTLLSTLTTASQSVAPIDMSALNIEPGTLQIMPLPTLAPLPALPKPPPPPPMPVASQSGRNQSGGS